MTEDSYIKPLGNGGAAFVGPDATRLFQAIAIKNALSLLERGIQPTRGFTMKRALAAATTFTGKSYPSTGRSRKLAVQDARADLIRWCDTMRAALPTVREGEQ